MLESLVSKVTKFFPKRKKSCLKNILLLCLCILDKNTVNLNKAKDAAGKVLGNTTTAPSSHYKRLIRIFDDFSFSSLWIELLRYGVQLLRLKYDHLILDGTSWKSGSRWFHYMTLCIVYKKVAIPIFWLDLNKHGNSNTKERKKLITKALRFFDLKGKVLLADREYIGQEWFKFLIDKGLDFNIRSKVNTYVEAINGSPGKSYEELVNKVQRSKVPTKALRKKFVLNGMELYFVVAKNRKPNAKEPLMFLITNVDKPASFLVGTYSIRWKIEQCFFHLKSNGFDLESLNLEGQSRCKLLMAATVFAYLLSVHEGLKTYKKVPMKKYKNGETRKAKSVFTHGREQLAVFCHSMTSFCKYINREIRQALNSYRSPDALNV